MRATKQHSSRFLFRGLFFVFSMMVAIPVKKATGEEFKSKAAIQHEKLARNLVGVDGIAASSKKPSAFVRSRPVTINEPWVDDCVQHIFRATLKLSHIDQRFVVSDHFYEEGDDGHPKLILYRYKGMMSGMTYLVASSKRHQYRITIVRDPKAEPTEWHQYTNRKVGYYFLSRRAHGVRAEIQADVAEVTEEDGDMTDRSLLFLAAAKPAAEECLKVAVPMRHPWVNEGNSMNKPARSF